VSVSTAIATATLLASVTHGAQFNVTAGPAKTAANPGQTISQQVSNNGTIPETISIGTGEIGHTAATGACGFTHSAPLATPGITSMTLRPGESGMVAVKIAKTGPAGYHAVTVDYTVAGTGAVKVAEGVATVIGVTYPGSTSSAGAPCVAVAQTPKPSKAPPVGPIALSAGLFALGGYGVRGLRRKRRRTAS
jgi:hypothetical protein